MKYLLFFITVLATILVWTHYFEVRQQSTSNSQELSDSIAQNAEQFGGVTDGKMSLSDAFWEWEAQGRLNLIDRILDDEQLVTWRDSWVQQGDENNALIEKAHYILGIQNESYGVQESLEPVKILMTPLRGDANGLYIPQDQTIYLNSRMKWSELPYERYLEVILHENMHHIMTRMMWTLKTDDVLYQDFMALTSAAYFHDQSGMAQDTDDLYQVNPQEIVAWHAQRAARYAGILGANIDAWQMTSRMQELKYLRGQAGL